MERKNSQKIRNYALIISNMLTNSGAASKTSPAQHTAIECCHAGRRGKYEMLRLFVPTLAQKNCVIYYFLLVYLLNFFICSMTKKSEIFFQ